VAAENLREQSVQKVSRNDPDKIHELENSLTSERQCVRGERPLRGWKINYYGKPEDAVEKCEIKDKFSFFFHMPEEWV
jgi:hypothetical protein